MRLAIFMGRKLNEIADIYAVAVPGHRNLTNLVRALREEGVIKTSVSNALQTFATFRMPPNPPLGCL